MTASEYWVSLSRRPLSRRRVLQGSALAGFGVASLGLVGCGDDDDEASTPTSGAGSTPTPSTSSTPAADQPVLGGTFRDYTTAELSAYDPYKNSSFTAQDPWAAISARLLKYVVDENHGPTDLTTEPDVAASMPEQPDGLTVTFKIREGVKFHNVAPMNGRELTADDVAFSIKRYQEMGNNKSKLNAIESVEATDATTLTLKLNRVTASLVPYFADPTLVWIMAPEFATNELTPESPRVGMGPFIYEGYETDVRTTHVKNPDYFITGTPYVDRLEVPILADTNVQDANYRSGFIDYLSTPDRDRFNQLQSSVEGTQTLSFVGIGASRIELAMQSEPFNNVDVRRAISMAIDRDEVAEALSAIDHGWCSHAFGPGFAPYYLDPQSSEFGESAKWFQYNPTEAKRIIDAVAPGGIEVPYAYTSFYAGRAITSELYADKLEAIGVKLNLQNFTYTEYQNKFQVGAFEDRLREGMVELPYQSQADPTGYFLVHHLPTASRQIMQFQDPEFERMVAEQDAELDFDNRVQLLYEIQRYMADRMIGVPQVTTATGVLIQPRVKNYRYRAGIGRPAESIAKAWVESA